MNTQADPEATQLRMTPSQQEALKAIYGFLASPSNKEFCLIGAAGTGKSFLIRHLCNHYQDGFRMLGVECPYNAIHLTATTNKAAQVLAQGDYPTEPTTIHKLLGLSLKEDRTTGNVSLQGNSFGLPENAIIIVDEASMIDYSLYKQINSKTPGCKIIFVGDARQLPPVKAIGNQPLVFHQKFPEAQLTEIVRQRTQSHLLKLCGQLRSNVEQGEDYALHVTLGEDVHWLKPSEVKPLVEHHFQNVTTPAKLLAYTNQQCSAYSNFIAHLHHPEHGEPFLPGEFLAGERVMCNGSSIKFYAGQEFIIKDVYETTIVQASIDIPCWHYEFYGSSEAGLVPQDMPRYRSILSELTRKRHWSTYFDLKSKIMELIRPYSLTVHKSQGSTYPTVFVDTDDLYTCTNPQVRRRLLYVAASRASQQLYLFGSDKAKKRLFG